MTDLIDNTEAADILNMHRNSIRRVMQATGFLPAKETIRRVWWNRYDVEILAALRTPSTERTAYQHGLVLRRLIAQANEKQTEANE